MVFRSLTFLEREGLICLPDHNELQSRLYITIGKEELYRFQLAHRDIGDMLTAILRLYGGLFTDFTPISESVIAQRCGKTETQVYNMLKELNRLQIAEYRPKTIKPQIIFTSPRIDIKDIYVSDRNYKDLKNAAEKRREAMIAYAENNGECRSRQLLRYFGETQSCDCGVCDVCIAKKKTSRNRLDDEIIYILAASPLTIKQLSERLPKIAKDELISTVRRLLDRGVLQTNQDLQLSCRNSS